MFKTKAFISQKIWGYERWIVSTHPAGKSSIDSRSCKNSGELLEDIIGHSYPLLIKVIQANETLSVQVHPDDEYARLHENSAGKTECWYVLDAKPGATLICGLNGTYSRHELEKAISNNTLDRYLKYESVSKGDFIFIPAGTVHAIQGGLKLLEVQQSSDITYRLYDWGRPREVHIQKGLDVIKHNDSPVYGVYKDFTGIFNCPYFRLEKKDFSMKGSFDYSTFTTPASQSGWCSFFVIDGNGTAQIDNQSVLTIKNEDCVVVPSNTTVTIVPDAGCKLSLILMG